MISFAAVECLPKETLQKKFLEVVSDPTEFNNLKHLEPETSNLSLKYGSFDGNSLSARDICHQLHSLPCIQSIKLTSVHDIIPVLRQICRCNRSLEKVVLKDCSSKTKEIPESVLLNILLSLTQLRAIELNKTQFKSHMFFKIVARQSNITSVDISFNKSVTVDDLMVLVHNSRLQEFKMSRRYMETKIQDLQMAHLIRSMRDQLTLLHLDVGGLSSFTYNEIFQCFKLTDIKLNSATNLSGELLKQLPKALKQIKCLKVEGPSLLAQGDLQNSLRVDTHFLNHLNTLKLHNFDWLLDKECSKILEHCLKLKYLSLKGCKSLTVEGLSESLLQLINLTHLNISFIGDSNSIERVTSMTSLNCLYIDDFLYKTNQYYIVSLKTIKPHLEVIKLKEKLKFSAE